MISSTIIDQALKYRKVNRGKATHFAVSNKGKIRFFIALSGKKRLASNISTYSRKLELLMKLLVYFPFYLLEFLKLGEYVSLSFDEEIMNYTNKVAEKRFINYAFNIIVGTYDDKQKLVIQCFDVLSKDLPAIYFKIGNQGSAKEMITEIQYLKSFTKNQIFSIPVFVEAQKINNRFKYNIQVSEEFNGEKVSPSITNEVVRIFKGIAHSKPKEINNNIPYVFSHGDFAPWNMKRSKDKYILFDWEHCGYRFYGFDLIHFIFRIENKLNNKSIEDAIQIAVKQAQQYDDMLRSIETGKLKNLYFEEYAITYGE